MKVKVCVYLEGENRLARLGFRTAFHHHVRALQLADGR